MSRDMQEAVVSRIVPDGEPWSCAVCDDGTAAQYQVKAVGIELPEAWGFCEAHVGVGVSAAIEGLEAGASVDDKVSCAVCGDRSLRVRCPECGK